MLDVDRLDYSKGIPERLRAYQWLLAEHPEWREQVVLLQVSVPSREKVLAYQEVRREVDALVGEINGTYGTTTWTPVQYLYRNLPFPAICALLRRAHVAPVTRPPGCSHAGGKWHVGGPSPRACRPPLCRFSRASSGRGPGFF